MDLAYRMREYEDIEAGRRFMRRLPVCVRVDGKRFSLFTADLNKPFDERFSTCMVETTKYLVTELHAIIGYCQSDEITLIFYVDNPDGSILFDGRISKLTSVVASMASVAFFKNLLVHLPEKTAGYPVFDGRAWAVPSKEEAVNVLIHREMDCGRNSVSIAANHKFSHSQLTGKSSKEKQEMLFQGHGINWNDYPDRFKRGTYVRRVPVLRKLSCEERERIPERWRLEEDALVNRTETVVLTMPPLAKIVNKVAVIFDGAQPELQDSKDAPS